MKNLYFVLLLVICSFTADAQNVNFTDWAFKSYLVNKPTIDTDDDEYPDAYIDTNLDGEIQLTEAAAVTKLQINYNYADFGIIDITGLEAFTNLKSFKSNLTVDYTAVNTLSDLENLDLASSRVNHLTVSGLTNLKSINCGSGLQTVNLSGLPNLETLICVGNRNLTSLNVNEFTNLKFLNCTKNGVTSLDLSNLVNLVDLRCEENLLTTINLSNNVNLENLNLSYFKGTTLNFPTLPNLKFLELTGSSLVTVDVSQLNALEDLKCPFIGSLSVLTLGNKPFLKSLWCSGANLSVLDTSNAPNMVELLCSENNITTLDVSNMPHLTGLWCEENQITALNVGADTSLETLSCANNLIPNLDVANLTNLTNLDCSNNQISNLDVTNLAGLKWLKCTNNNLTALNTTNLTNLSQLYVDDNDISSIDVSNMASLVYFYCSGNNLTSLNISNLSKMRYFNCSDNQLTELELPSMTFFYSNHGTVGRSSYNCSNNLFTTLDFSPISCNTSSVYFAGNPNLTYVNLKNSRTKYSVRSMDNCPNLNYICINAYLENPNAPYGGVFQYITDQSLFDGVQINPYCSFTPDGVYNTITGKFSMDLDNNGCDTNDFHFPDSKITIDNTPAAFRATYTDINGVFNFYTLAGNYVIKPAFEHPYFTVTPASATITFADSDNSIQTQDFCVIPNGVHKDLEITLLPTGRARPGFDVRYKLVYKNKGNQMLSGNVNLTFDDAVLDFVSAIPTLSNQTTNTLNWAYTNLKPFESRSIELTLNLNSPMEIPAVNNGDILNFSAVIDPVSGDETIADNTSNLVQTVMGSYDPNDKICLEGNTITPEQVGGFLHYLIRFQNSGTAPAENIVVKDIIDADKFDITSLELTSTSHPQITKISGNKVEFQFENINLPTETEDEPGSHGHVAFKIKTKAGLAIGSSVSNTADIYFDYNFPITTDPATSTVALLGVGQFENTSVNVAPNPVQDLLHINAKATITSVQLLDLQGRVLETRLFSSNQVDFDFSQKATGVYFVKIYTDKGQKVEKIIKD